MGVVAIVAVVLVASLAASAVSLRFRSRDVERDGRRVTLWTGFVLSAMVGGALAVLVVGGVHIADGTYREMSIVLRIAFMLVGLAAIFMAVGTVGILIFAAVVEPLDAWAYRKMEPMRRWSFDRRMRRSHVRRRSQEARLEAEREWDEHRS